MDNTAIIGLLTAVIPAYVAGRFALKQWRLNTQSTKDTAQIAADNAIKIEQLKTEATKEIEITKLATDKETKRIDQIVAAQQKLIDRQDQRIIRLEGNQDRLQENMNVCIEERTKFAMRANEIEKKHSQVEALLAATEAQLKNVGLANHLPGVANIEYQMSGTIKPNEDK